MIKVANYCKSAALAGALLLINTACDDKFTELSPYTRLSETLVFDSPANIELTANGVYSQAAIGTYNGSTGRGYPFGAASIIQSEMRGEDFVRSEEHTSELQSRENLVCRLLLEKIKTTR